MSVHTPLSPQTVRTVPAETLLEDEFPHDAPTLRWLKLGDTHFCNLAERYHALGRALRRIEANGEPESEGYCERLRKQRLSLLDEIAVMLERAEARLVPA